MSAASIPALPHRWRLWAIVIFTLLDLAALAASHLGVGPELLAEARPLVETALSAVLLVLVPALGDAYLVERRRRSPGIPALPDDQVGNGWPETPTQPSRPAVLRPPSDGALALVLVVAAAALSAATSGCGASQFQAQVQIAAAFEDSSRETRDLVRTYRTGAMRAAARAVHETGGDEQTAIAAARAKGDELAPLVEAQRLYALASHAYVDALWIAEHRSEGFIDSVYPALRDLLDAYRHLRRLGAELGVDELASLPATPSWLDGLIPPQLLAPEAVQEGGAR